MESAEVNEDKITVEVAYALPEQQVIVSLNVSPGTTVRAAIEQSGMLTKFEEIDLEKNAVGVFSKKVTLDQVLRNRDRVEIYRPLIADPKQVRKQRAAEGKKMRKGGGAEDSK
jgi:hypothetical protein